MKHPPDEHRSTPRCWNCSLDLEKVRLVRINEAAQLCEVSPSTMRHWLEEGDVEWLRLPSGNPLIVADTLPTGQRPARGLRGGNGTRPPIAGVPCFVCGQPAERSRILLDVDQAKTLCRVGSRTMARWVSDGLVETEQGYFYLDSLFKEPRRFRDLDVRG
ncbi:MAG: hypothetical protein V3T83_05750 [Acidobacteriota bacterium]